MSTPEIVERLQADSPTLAEAFRAARIMIASGCSSFGLVPVNRHAPVHHAAVHIGRALSDLARGSVTILAPTGPAQSASEAQCPFPPLPEELDESPAEYRVEVVRLRAAADREIMDELEWRLVKAHSRRPLLVDLTGFAARGTLRWVASRLGGAVLI